MELVPSVLLVAASPETLEPVAVELAVTGFRSQIVTTGAEALAKAAGRSYDVVIISADLSGADVPSLVRQFKLLQPGMACVVVAGQASREGALHALAAGALGVFAEGVAGVVGMKQMVGNRSAWRLVSTRHAVAGIGGS